MLLLGKAEPAAPINWAMAGWWASASGQGPSADGRTNRKACWWVENKLEDRKVGLVEMGSGGHNQQIICGGEGEGA